MSRKEHSQPEQWLTVNQAAGRYGVSPRCVRKWLNAGKLKGRREGRRWRVLDHGEGSMQEKLGQPAPGCHSSGSRSKPEKANSNGNLPPP